MNDLLIIIDPALAEKMDRDLITPADARRTIAWCEDSGVKLRDDVTGDFVGHRRFGALTYWVRYRWEDGTYRLVSIYTHRAALEDKPAVAGSAWPGITCLKCNERLTVQKVTFQYLDFPVSTPLPCCPSCRQVYLSEEFVEGKLSEVEKTLEDK